MILPSRKVLSLFILTAALVVAVIIAFGKEKGSSAINYASNLVAGEKISVPENSDWQAQVKTVAGTADLSKLEEESATSETVTDSVSRSIISNYLALKQGGTLDQESVQKLVDQAANYAVKSPNISVTLSELNIISDNGTKSIMEYGEKLGSILKANKPTETKDEFSILQEALATKDPKKIEELSLAVEVYKKFLNEVLAMPVPKTFVKAHTDIIIGFKSLIAGLENMEKVLDDPIKGLQGVQTYQQGGTLFIRAIQASLEFIKRSGIVYKQGTGGYYLLYGI